VKIVWEELKAMNAGPLDCYDHQSGTTINKNIRDYIVGPEAIELGRNGWALKHCATDVYYRPSGSSG
jgi:hypothetical protein